MRDIKLHKYLRAIGFSECKTNKEIKDLIKECVIEANHKFFTVKEEKVVLSEYHKEFAPGIGISVFGEMDDMHNFNYEYYYPYIRTFNISSYEDITIERHKMSESYSGICDDVRVGVALIFYLQNVTEYIKFKDAGKLPVKGTSLCLSALSVEGTVMMPIMKNEKQKDKISKDYHNRCKMIMAARRGDEEAIEYLALDDMDTYSNISRRIRSEDVFSLVESYFMPYGVETDLYSILGEIKKVDKVENKSTGEQLYIMTVSTNELLIDVCINEKDLYGEPEIGRRFKGNIWLQGFINFPML